MEIKMDKWETDDISLAAYLIVKGVKLLEFKENRPNHFIFILADPNLCAELRQEYLNKGMAAARELFSVREMLISEIKNRNRYGDKNHERA